MNRFVQRQLAPVVLAMGLATSGVALAWASADEVPPPVPAAYTQEGALDVWRLRLPGRLESSTAHCTHGDRDFEAEATRPPPSTESQRKCDLFLIVRAPADWRHKEDGAAVREDSAALNAAERVSRPNANGSSERSLYRLSLQEEASLQGLAWLPRLEENKDSDPHSVAPRLEILDIEGRLNLFIAWMARGFLHRLGEASSVREHGTLHQIVQLAEGAGWRTMSVLDERTPMLTATDVGLLDVFWMEGDDLAEQRYRLPVQVERQSGGLRLSSPPVRRLQTKPAVLAVGPEEHGHLRLRTVLLDPSPRLRQDPAIEGIPSAALDSEENVRWSALPGLERVIASQYWVIEGRPVLAVVTLRTDRMGILERKKLRLFGLDAERTRAGSSPFFATFSASRLWQRLSVDVVAARGAGSQDLVLVQPEGLGGGKLAIDLYAGIEGLGFAPKPVRSIVRVPESWWKYGEDWSGDEVADLLSLSSGVLRLFAGRGFTKKGFLERDPSWEHQVFAPERQSVGSKGKSKELRPRRHATYKHGILVVRSRYSEGSDLIEVVTPRSGVKSLVVASLSSGEPLTEDQDNPP